MAAEEGEGTTSESPPSGWEGKEKMWGRGRMGPKIAIFIVVAIVFLVLWPFAFIWALNTVFLLGIDLNFWTWLATVVILVTLGFLFSFGRNT
ncbi:MAG: hypothetical protein ACE5EW_03765 [Thermoplasmata archaeon]